LPKAASLKNKYQICNFSVELIKPKYVKPEQYLN
jgi:hypothetical protein